MIPIESELFFAKFPDGGLYAAGPQGKVPGGPIAYQNREMAQEAANVINGRVVVRTMEYAVKFCLNRGFTLFIRNPDGRTGFIPETVPDEPGMIYKVTDHEGRQGLIDIEAAQRNE